MFCCRSASHFFNKGTYTAQIDESKCKKQESEGNGGTSSDGAAASSASLVSWSVNATTELDSAGGTVYKVQCWVTHSQIFLTDGAPAVLQPSVLLLVPIACCFRLFCSLGYF